MLKRDGENVCKLFLQDIEVVFLSSFLLLAVTHSVRAELRDEKNTNTRRHTEREKREKETERERRITMC